MTRTAAVSRRSVGSVEVGKQTGDPLRRSVRRCRCRSQTVLMCSRVNIFWVGGGGWLVVVGGVPWVKGRPPPAQLQVWSRPPGAGAGHHWYLYTAPPPVIWPPDHCSAPPPFSVPTILRFCLFARTKIEVVQRIVTADSSSCKWCRPLRRLLAMLRRFVPPIKG